MYMYFTNHDQVYFLHIELNNSLLFLPKFLLSFACKRSTNSIDSMFVIYLLGAFPCVKHNFFKHFKSKNKQSRDMLLDLYLRFTSCSHGNECINIAGF